MVNKVIFIGMIAAVAAFGISSILGSLQVVQYVHASGGCGSQNAISVNVCNNKICVNANVISAASVRQQCTQ
jgi:hypothetical protein